MSNLKNIVPIHVAIIPDGNRRWAKAKNLPTFEGHRQGFERIAEITKSARRMGIKILSLWAFSTENWKRSTEEVKYLMRLYELMFDRHLKDALVNRVRLIHLGRRDRLSPALLGKIRQAEEKTKKYDENYLVIALDYGGHSEMLRAFQRISNIQFPISKLNEENINQFLDTKDLPQPNVDLLIRTSGEERTSGFMIWQAAYAEYIFHPKHMPDFTVDDFTQCIKQYQNRQRRFGN